MIPSREEMLHALRAQRPLFERFGVESVALFGSLARDEATENSDVDLLVEFSKPIGLLQFAALRRVLAEALGRPVDLVTRNALKPQLRDQILREAIRAA